MPQTHDIGRRFVTTMKYPPTGSWPRYERDAYIREIEEPYRIGSGTAVRIPLTRYALIFGRWDDDGGDEVERLTEALRASDVDADSDDIRSW